MYKDKLKDFIKKTPELTQRQIANVLGITDQAMYKKLNHAKKGFSIEEAIMIRDYLKTKSLYMDEVNLNKIEIKATLDTICNINKKGESNE